MAHWLRRFSILCLLFMHFAGCSGKAKPADQAGSNAAAPVEAPPAFDMRPRPGLLYTFLAEGGEVQTTEALEDIPAAARASVRVIDLNVPPEARGAGKWVFIADLRRPNADGSYPYRALSHVSFDKALASAAANEKVASALAKSSQQITVYTTAWCGVCKQAKAFLQQRNVQFVERDVERDDQAAAELGAKAKRAGVMPQGVPVIDVYGELMLGFDPERLLAMLAKHGDKPAETL